MGQLVMTDENFKVVNDRRYIAIETEHDECNGCVFNHLTEDCVMGCHAEPACGAKGRQDRRNVIWQPEPKAGKTEQSNWGIW